MIEKGDVAHSVASMSNFLAISESASMELEHKKQKESMVLFCNEVNPAIR